MYFQDTHAPWETPADFWFTLPRLPLYLLPLYPSYNSKEVLLGVKLAFIYT